MNSNLTRALLVLAAVLVATLGWRELQLRRSTLKEKLLSDQLARLQSVEEENARLRAEVTNNASSRRLRELEAENLRLKSKLTQSRVELAPSSRKTNRVDQASPEIVYPTVEEAVRSYKAELQSAVGWRQTLVTGGWKTGPEKQAFVLVQPVPDHSNPDQVGVLMQVRIVEMSDQALQQLGLKWETTSERQSAFKALFSEHGSEELLKSLEKTAGVDLLSAPRVMSAPGRQAQVQVVELKTIAPNQTVEIGPIVDLTPTLKSDGNGIDLTLAARLNLLNQ